MSIIGIMAGGEGATSGLGEGDVGLRGGVSDGVGVVCGVGGGMGAGVGVGAAGMGKCVSAGGAEGSAHALSKITPIVRINSNLLSLI